LGRVLGRVHPHVYAAVFGFFMPHAPALYALADGIFLDAKPTSSLLYGHLVLGCVLGCVPSLSHTGDTRALVPGAKALRSHPRALEDEYAGRAHAKRTDPQIAQSGENRKEYRPDRAPPF
jgi:hypothetical protein